MSTSISNASSGEKRAFLKEKGKGEPPVILPIAGRKGRGIRAPPLKDRKEGKEKSAAFFFFFF